MTTPIKLLYSWYRQALRHPNYRWWLIGGTLLWMLNPINTIPVVGEIDEALVVTIFAAEVSQVLIDTIKNKRQQQGAIVNSAIANSNVE